MPRRVKQTNSQPPIAVNERKPPVEVSRLDRQLTRIFSGLATLLLRHGYGYGRITRLAKVAFVDAAIALNTRDHSKQSIARIAALTGLTRIEVSRLIRRSRLGDEDINGELNRATQVADGWQNDPRFLDEKKRPRSLQLSPSRGGFGELVKKYSGDIPARAMFIEMERLGMVRLTSESAVSLVRPRPLLPRTAIDAVRAITPWVNVLSELQEDTRAATLSSTTDQLRLNFDSFPQVLAAIRELENRRQSFTEAVGHLGTKSKRKGKYELTVYVAVAAAKPAREIPKRLERRRK